MRCNPVQPTPCSRKQDILCKEIAACITRHTEFREYHNLRSCVCRLVNQTAYLLCIISDIPNPDIRRCSRHLQKTILHLADPLLFHHPKPESLPASFYDLL